MPHGMRAYLTLCEMNAREFVRDPVAGFFSFFFPLLFLLIFGISEAFQTPFSFQLGVVGGERGGQVERLREIMAADGFVQTHDLTPEEGDAQLRDGRVGALLVVPPAQPTGPAPAFRLIVDERWSKMATSMLNSARADLAREESGLVFPLGYTIERPTTETVSDFTYIFPGLIAMALLQLGLFATAAPLLRARDRGTLRHLSTTPVSRVSLVMAQLTVRFAVAAMQLLVLIGLGTMLFRVNIAGSWFSLVLVTGLGAVMLIAVGYAIAGLAPSMESGMVMVMLMNFAMLFFGQVFFDLSSVSFLRPIIYAMPLTYLSDILRHVVIGVTGLFSTGVAALVLIAWTAAAITVASSKFKFDMEAR